MKVKKQKVNTKDGRKIKQKFDLALSKNFD